MPIPRRELGPRAREDYENGTEPLDVIAAREGVSRSTLLARAKEGGWQRKHNPIRRPRRSKMEIEAEQLAKARRILGASIVGRLYVVIDRNLKEIEARMQNNDDGHRQTAAEAEREARTLAALTRLYEKLVALEGEAKREAESAKQEEEKRAKADLDADSFRLDLAERLKRLSAASN